MNLGILTEEVGSLEEAAQAYRQAIDLLGALPRGNSQRVANQEWYADTLRAPGTRSRPDGQIGRGGARISGGGGPGT